jgi:uncharacterized protein (DUF1800 family)
VASLDPSPTDVYTGQFTARQAARLLWRAGFGPRPGDCEATAKLGLDGAVASLTRPSGAAQLIGAAPHDDKGHALDPFNVWGDDHCWWLDRMVRSTHQLVERMTLIWHSWFATSEQASNGKLMINQNWMMRRHWLGNFHALLLDVTKDPAMLLWLDGAGNSKQSPNENYGREMLELFSLGADRGYDQHDVHENSRALTGFTFSWNETGPADFHFEPSLHDDGVKTIFGHRGRWNWQDSCRLAVTNPEHPSFFVSKLWGYFVGAPIPTDTQRALEHTYVAAGFEIRPIVEAILRHPLFYEGPKMVIPPVVFSAGLMRGSRQTITTTSWAWVGDITGQMLFQPPNVAGWNYAQWLDTSRWSGRVQAVNQATSPFLLNGRKYPYGDNETAERALVRALAFWGDPELSQETHDRLLALSRKLVCGMPTWEIASAHNARLNALRAVIPMTNDYQTC